MINPQMNSSERKGLIALIIIILLLTVYRFIESRVELIQSSATAVPFASNSDVPVDTILEFQDSVTSNTDTVARIKHSKKSKSTSAKKQRKSKSRKSAPPKAYPTRNPLSEPV